MTALASLPRIAFTATVVLLLMLTASVAQSNSRYIKQSPGNAVVIVFVHGILGDSTSTWTHENGTYWPTLLANDPFFSTYDVYVYEYPTGFFGRNFSIDEIAENMRLLFEVDGVADYPRIVFVSHSMGGLVTRAYLNKNRRVAEHVKLAYFYSTPTTGSELGKIGALISANPQLAKMEPMQSSDYLADLQRQWLSINSDIPSFCAYETLNTYGMSVVTQASASNLCNRRLDPIDADHLTIVKPASDRDSAYLALKAAVRQTTADSTAYEIYASYSRRDSRFVKPMIQYLRPTGAKIFLGEDAIEPGKKWAIVIAEAIQTCRVVYLFWSSHSATSLDIQEEYSQAINLRKDIVPVLLDGTPLPDNLKDYQGVDLRGVIGKLEVVVEQTLPLEEGYERMARDREAQGLKDDQVGMGGPEDFVRQGWDERDGQWVRRVTVDREIPDAELRRAAEVLSADLESRMEGGE